MQIDSVPVHETRTYIYAQTEFSPVYQATVVLAQAHPKYYSHSQLEYTDGHGQTEK